MAKKIEGKLLYVYNNTFEILLVMHMQLVFIMYHIWN